MGFFSSLFGGSSPELNQALRTSQGITGFALPFGQQNLTNASDFWNTILKGDPQAIAKLLAPQISAIQGQGQQQLKTAAEFGNRSGGTNAAAQQNIDTQRAAVERMIAELTGQAGSQVGQLGESVYGMGIQGNRDLASQAEQKIKNIQGSLFGGMLTGLTGLAGDALTGFLGKIPGLRGVI